MKVRFQPFWYIYLEICPVLETPQPQKNHPGPRSQHSSGQLPQYFLQHNQGRSFGPGNPCGQSLEHKQNREKSLQPLTYKVICMY